MSDPVDEHKRLLYALVPDRHLVKYLNDPEFHAAVVRLVRFLPRLVDALAASADFDEALRRVAEQMGAEDEVRAFEDLARSLPVAQEDDMIVDYRPLHDCGPPSLPEVGRYVYGEDYRHVFARWRCPECRARWELSGVFLTGRVLWKRTSEPSWRWRRREARRLAAITGEDDREEKNQ